LNGGEDVAPVKAEKKVEKESEPKENKASLIKGGGE
jgi:hypothetical protein